MNPIRQHIVDFCHKEVGTKEKPSGSNKVKYNDWYYPEGHAYFKNSKPYAWCGTFCAYIYHFAGLHLTTKEFEKIMYVPSIWNHYKALKRITDNPQAGDLVIFDWQHDNFQDHIGIFVEWKDRKAGRFISIEGNTSSDHAGDQSNGGMVCEKLRSTEHVAAFCVPDSLDILI